MEAQTGLGVCCFYRTMIRNTPVRQLPQSLLIFAVAFFASLAMTSCAVHSGPSSTASQTSKGVEAPVVIKVPDELAKQIDLRTEEVKMRPLAAPQHLTGHIEPSWGKEVDVSTRISGRVREILVKPGQFVPAKHLMAVIDSREISELEAEMIEAKNKLGFALAHQEREKQIYEEQIERPRALIDAQSVYRKAKVQKELSASELKRIQALHNEKIAAAKDLISAQAAFAQAQTAYEQAAIDLQREEHLYGNKAIMKRDYSFAQSETDRDRQHLNTLVQRLEFLGTSSAEIDDLLKTKKIKGTAFIVAPQAGVVSHYDVAVGEVVHPDRSLFKITDLSSVIVSADLPEVDLQKVKLGDKVKVKIASYPNEVFEGTISFISEHIHPDTRMVSIRAHLDNSARRLKPNMYAEIDLEEENPKLVLLCPKSAIQEHNGHKIVFVSTP
ncbi:MAG: hypothetical protein C5B53_02475, partial [Candidatus Melainabacteria bacterium]